MATRELERWFCGFCLSPCDIREGQNDACRKSLVANKTIEQMMDHMIAVHGYKKPTGYDQDKQKAKNKAKAHRRKKNR